MKKFSLGRSRGYSIGEVSILVILVVVIVAREYKGYYSVSRLVYIYRR